MRPGSGWRGGGGRPPGAGGGDKSLPPQILLLRKLACSLLPVSSQLGSPRAGCCGQWFQFTSERCLVAGLVVADMLWHGRAEGEWLGGTLGGSGLPDAQSPPGCEWPLAGWWLAPLVPQPLGLGVGWASGGLFWGRRTWPLRCA